MTKKISTKRSLLLCALSLLMCVSMLVGSTFAWFTDEVVSANNIIKSGNLDIEMYYADGTDDPSVAEWKDASEGEIFKYNLWEPGYSEVRHVKIANAGTLALKYTVNILPTGEVSKLAEVIDVYFVDPATQVADRKALAESYKVGTLADVIAGRAGSIDGKLLANENVTVTIALKMQEEAGNEYQNLAIGSSFAVQVFATQLTYEEDSFDNMYDEEAPSYELTEMDKIADGEWEISTPGQLLYFADAVNSGDNYYAGETIVLANDIDLAGINWTPIGSATAEHGFMGNFDGNGKKIQNLSIINPDSVDGYAYAGFFGVTEGTDKDNQNYIKNLVIENVTISTEGDIVAAAIAYPYYTALENITVCGDIKINGGNYTSGALAYTRRCVDAKNITVSGNAGSTITGGTTVGGVISDIQMNGGLKANYSNFAASNLTITGKGCVGGISGIICLQTLDGANVTDVTLNCGDARVGIVSGADGGDANLINATYSNVEGATELIGAAY